MTIDISADAPRLRQVMGLPPQAPLPLLHAIILQMNPLDENWDPPDGIFNPEILAQPGVLSNAQNGYGLSGSVGWYIHTWSAAPQ